MEFVWNLHGGIFYYAVRHHVYQIKMPVPLMSKVEFAVDNFLAGAKTVYPKLLLINQPKGKTSAKRSASKP
jgi:hypothetical protein